MNTKSFKVFGRRVGSTEPYISMDLTGVDYDGTVHMEDADGNSYSFSASQMRKMRNDKLIMSDAEMQSANTRLVKLLDGFVGNIPQEANEKATREMHNGTRGIFRAVLASAQG